MLSTLGVRSDGGEPFHVRPACRNNQRRQIHGSPSLLRSAHARHNPPRSVVAGSRCPTTARRLSTTFLLGLTGSERHASASSPPPAATQTAKANSFERAFGARAETSVLSLFGHDPWGHGDPRMLLEQDVVYVGGGSTANLLAVWRLHGLPDVLAEAAAQGVILAGVSAGMNCWFEGSSTDSFGPLAPWPTGSDSSTRRRVRTTLASRAAARSNWTG